MSNWANKTTRANLVNLTKWVNVDLELSKYLFSIDAVEILPILPIYIVGNLGNISVKGIVKKRQIEGYLTSLLLMHEINFGLR